MRDWRCAVTAINPRATGFPPGARDKGSHHFLSRGLPTTRSSPCPASRASKHSHSSWPLPIEGACVPAASSRERWGHGSRHGHGLDLQTAAGCRCKWLARDESDSYGFLQQNHPSAVASRAESSRARHDGSCRSWSGRGCRRLDPRWPSCVVGLSFDGRGSSLTGSPSLHCYPRCGGVSLIHTQAGMMLQSYPP